MKIITLLAVCLVFALSSCTTTRLEQSWADPTLTAEVANPFTKVLVVAPLRDESARRIAEDKIVSKMRPGVGISSYTKLLNAGSAQQSEIDKMLKEQGFDGVILMRLKDVEKSVTYTPGTAYYGGWYGYSTYTPGYYSEDKTFLVETSFFSLRSDKLIWSGVTSSLNPSSLEKTMDEIIAAIKYELQRKGVLK